jgi:ferrous iron transport protein B
MGTRIIDDEHERIISAAVTPLIPCGARIAVITAVVPVFFGYGWEATLVTLFLFSVSMLAVAVVARLLRKTAFKNQHSSLVLEMPDYRLPSPVNVLRTTARRTYSSMLNALVLFPPFAVVIWALFNLPHEAATADTIGMQLAVFLTPAGAIIGLAGKEMMSFLFAFPAKELTLLFLGLIYAGGSDDISGALLSAWTPLQAISFLVFLILYSPCLGTLNALSKEVGWKWALRTTAITLGAGFGFTAVIYWGGVLLGLG